MAASILALIAGLVTLHFVFGLFLDCTILDAPDRAWKAIHDVSMIIFPFRRSHVMGETDNERNSDLGNDDPEAAEHARIQMSSRTVENSSLKKQLVHELLHFSVFQSDNPAHCPNNDLSCSICLREFEKGNSVFNTTACDHMFHASCITDWIVASSVPDCPNCRSHVLSREQWDAELRVREGLR